MRAISWDDDGRLAVAKVVAANVIGCPIWGPDDSLIRLNSQFDKIGHQHVT